jgi:hypothetical protein
MLFRRSKRKVAWLGAWSALCGVLSTWRLQAALPPAGAEIVNRATAEFIDAQTGITGHVASDPVRVIVQSVFDFTLVLNQNMEVEPGATVSLAHR